MPYHFALIDDPRRKLVQGLVGPFEQKHFQEVWPLRHYSYEAFKRKVLKIFEEPDLTQATFRELFETKQGTEETLDDYMSRVQFLERKSFPKLDLQNRESNAVTAFCKGLVEHDAAKLAAVQSEGKVAKAMKIAASVTALSATPHARTSQGKRYNAKSNRYHLTVAMDEDGDDQLRWEGEESQD